METLTSGYGLIEAPVWDNDRGLLFSDVLGGGVFSVRDADEVLPIIEHRRGIGGMVPHEDRGLIVSGRNIAYKPRDGGASIVLFDRDVEADRVGFNDITVDAAGRIYAGSLGSSPVFDDGREPQAGKLYLIDLDGSVRVVAEDVRLTNGLGFSPDGRTLYHSDSARNAVMSYAVAEDGSLGEKQLFVETERGAPDGLAVSVDGAVWVALAAGGHGVAVFDPAGSEREFIKIPEPMCTSVCFGGDDLRDLYIVSGSDGMPNDAAGAVHRVRVDVAGLPLGVARVPVPTS